MEDKVIDLYINKELSFNEIYKLIGISRYKVKKIICNSKIKKRSFSEQMSVCLKKRQTDITNYDSLKSIIEGGLLGDGGIYKVKYQSYYQQGSINQDYIYYLREIFKDSNLHSRIFKHSKKGNRKDFFVLTTRSNMFLENLRNKWYVNNIKIVPEDLKIDKISLKHWWVGDGYLNSICGWGTLSTQSFTEREVIFLKSLLNKITDNYITLRKDSNSIGRFFLYISRKAINDIIDYIEECPVESFSYKWRKKKC